jgi:hypothetical protein
MKISKITQQNGQDRFFADFRVFLVFHGLVGILAPNLDPWSHNLRSPGMGCNAAETGN